jgi:serine/threonine-protein kinase PpkA
MSLTSVDIPGYAIEKLIAEGGMASVYLGRQESLDRPVALKLLRKFDNPEQALRFFNEGRIIASLEHRNIITIFDLGVVGERHYLAMEYLQGGDLRARINAGMASSEVLDLIETLGSCLSFVHQKGIIHRDIKPENILFRQDGSVVLTDFGVAKQIESNSSLTMDGIALGSPYYLSPEQAQCRELDGRADIYSLGIICYEMLTGVKPFQGDSPLETIMAHINTELPPLPAHLSYCQPLLARMVAVNPRDRFACAAELVDFVSRVRTVHAKHKRLKIGSPTQLENAKSWATRLNGVQHQLAVAAMLMLAGVMLIIVFLWQPKLETVDEPISAAHVVASAPLVTETGLNAAKAVEQDRNGLAITAPVAESQVAVATTVESGTAATVRQPLPTAMEALRQADALIKERPLTLPKLQKAYDLYQLILEKNPLHPDGLRGTTTIANKFIEIQNEIQRYLRLADAAIKNNRLAPPQPNNAADFYRQVLQLEPGRPEAKEGLDRLARLSHVIGTQTP